MFLFRFYDVGKHRVARCEKTGVLIDSSSEVGAAVLGENEEWTSIHGLNGCWKYFDGISAYERTSKHKKMRVFPISQEEAIGACLEEVAKDTTFVYLFPYEYLIGG